MSSSATPEATRASDRTWSNVRQGMQGIMRCTKQRSQDHNQPYSPAPALFPSPKRACWRRLKIDRNSAATDGGPASTRTSHTKNRPSSEPATTKPSEPRWAPPNRPRRVASCRPPQNTASWIPVACSGNMGTYMSGPTHKGGESHSPIHTATHTHRQWPQHAHAASALTPTHAAYVRMHAHAPTRTPHARTLRTHTAHPFEHTQPHTHPSRLRPRAHSHLYGSADTP
jgi:hypothetical protein